MINPQNSNISCAQCHNLMQNKFVATGMIFTRIQTHLQSSKDFDCKPYWLFGGPQLVFPEVFAQLDSP